MPPWGGLTSARWLVRFAGLPAFATAPVRRAGLRDQAARRGMARRLQYVSFMNIDRGLPTLLLTLVVSASMLGNAHGSRRDGGTSKRATSSTAAKVKAASKRAGKPPAKKLTAASSRGALADPIVNAFAKPELTVAEAEQLIAHVTQKIGESAQGDRLPYDAMARYDAEIAAVAAVAVNPEAKKLLTAFTGVEAYVKFQSRPNRKVSLAKLGKKTTTKVFADRAGNATIKTDAAKADVIRVGDQEFVIGAADQDVTLANLPIGWNDVAVTKVGRIIAHGEIGRAYSYSNSSYVGIVSEATVQMPARTKLRVKYGFQRMKVNGQLTNSLGAPAMFRIYFQPFPGGTPKLVFEKASDATQYSDGFFLYEAAEAGTLVLEVEDTTYGNPLRFEVEEVAELVPPPLRESYGEKVLANPQGRGFFDAALSRPALVRFDGSAPRSKQ